MRLQQHPPSSQSSGGTLELFVARSGVLSARIATPLGPIHLHSTVDPAIESMWFEDTEFWGECIVFLGTGLGYHIAPFVNKIPSRSKVILVEYYPRCMDHCLKKVSGSLPDAPVIITPAVGGWEQIAAAASQNSRTIQIIKHPPSYAANKEWYDAVQNRLRFKHRSVSSPVKPQRALLFYGSFFCEEELRRALVKQDGGASLFHYNNTVPGSSTYESVLSKTLQVERPDFILTVNMKGLDNQGIVGDLAARMGIPVVAWFVDDPHPILLQHRPFIKNHYLAFTWERSYLPWLSNLGFGSVDWLPLAADETGSTLPEPPEMPAEVGFTGSSMGQGFLDTIVSQFLWKPELQPLANTAAQVLIRKRDTPVWPLVEACAARTGIRLPFTDDKNITWFCSYIIHTASMMLRKELVSAALPLGLKTFGDPEGWKQLIGNHIPTAPDIDYRTGIAAVYRSIAVNINITSCQMPTAVNQRVFDVPQNGSFVLCDRQKDLDTLFAPDEAAVYGSREELLDKISYYKLHDTERRAITERARNRIRGEHTYTHRIESIRKKIPC